jgi:hypothetical protein
MNFSSIFGAASPALPHPWRRTKHQLGALNHRRTAAQRAARFAQISGWGADKWRLVLHNYAKLGL